MKRLIVLLAAIVMLSGCVIHETYREPYYAGGNSGGYTSAPGEGYYESEGYSGDSYSYQNSYSSQNSYDSGGDYYYGYDSGYGASSSWVVDYPFYYSLFWPINHWYRDPYWYPGYHYGVTWFPRSYYSSYYSFSVSYSHYWPHHHYNYLAYSPYRYSWVDNYYDNRPWYGRSRPRYDYNRYYPLPRYGSAHNEAERLAAVRRVQRPVAGMGISAPRPGAASRANAGQTPRVANRTPTASGIRGTDVRSTDARNDVRRQSQGARTSNDNPRTDVRGNAMNPRGNIRPNASNPMPRQPNGTASREVGRMTTTDRQMQPTRSRAETMRPMPQSGYQARELPLRSSAGSSVPPRNVERISPVPSVSANPDRTVRMPSQSVNRNVPMRSTVPAAVRSTTRPMESQPVERSYPQSRQAAPVTRPVYTSAPERSRAQPVYRTPSAPAPSYSAPAQSYSAPPRQSAPSHSYQAPSRPQSYSTPEPSSSSSHSSDSGSSRSSSGRSSSSGNVRRVGSDRGR